MMTICYVYDGKLYVNPTNRCDCACTFCVRNNGHRGSIYADDLWLEREPSRHEILNELLERLPAGWPELVFCGFGEPTYRIDDILWVIDQLKQASLSLPPIRLNTNGHANLINERDVTPELEGRIDTLSISLNASSCEKYLKITRPQAGAVAWDSMLEFTRLSLLYVPKVTMTVVDMNSSALELASCKELCNHLGVTLRVRKYVKD